MCPFRARGNPLPGPETDAAPIAMLIVCPACASEYRIDAERVGTSGRSVRCAACRETWFISADEVVAAMFDEMSVEEESVPPPPPMPEPAGAGEADAPVDGSARRSRPAAAKEGRRGKPKPKAGRLSPALAASLFLAAALPLVLLGRASVVRAMPQTAGLFARVGLPVNLRGIDLADVAAFQVPAEGSNPARLVVEGDLVAVARERVVVPPIEVEVRDAEGQPLYRWSVAGPRSALEPGERARFKASLSAPPEKGRQIEVRFSDAAPAETGGGESR
ncbi:MJ0042 family finger-like protein [Methylorubrum populi]|uniref:MJ0042 family finger-like protein n=2 Tax=Methylorubrum populi TaxID=223967 RepID=A0A160PHD1_9HYPH|nr:MJ0042 family finger-like protein [Methylorubrum populi]